jgi:hypothetical protein
MRPRGRCFYRVRGREKPIRGVNADAGGRPDGNFNPKTSVMTTLLCLRSPPYFPTSPALDDGIEAEVPVEPLVH